MHPADSGGMREEVLALLCEVDKKLNFMILFGLVVLYLNDLIVSLAIV